MITEHDGSSLATRITRHLTMRHVRARVTATGGCLQPVHLSGYRVVTDRATGRTLDHHAGTVYAPCGNRRESVCPACSDRYAADAFHLIRAGMTGGKAIPESVADKPRLFVTLTAPSFGAVHGRRTTRTGRRIPCGCGENHHEADPRVGTAIAPESYDYRGAVLWQGHTGDLWHRFTIRLRREIARAAGIKVSEFAEYARLSYAKVAEYQKRGLIHFHAVIRLDGPEGAHDPAPTWADNTLMEHAVRAAVETTHVTREFMLDGKLTEHVFTWGQQIDIRPIRPAHAAQIEGDDGEISDRALAGYIAKYATKGTSTSEVPDRPIRSERAIEHLDVLPHHRRMIATAWELGASEDLTFLRKWAHMLGFRGHFLTKSQRYSVTFTMLRGDRRTHQHLATLEALGTTPDGAIVVNHWNYTGNGHNNPEEREIAEAIYEGKRLQRKDKLAKENQ
ncbi:replication initiator [Amycolatopsis orientalis]|uniref:replication initiator n=1 Tax=Amycolatopsis orientalis TaxID=31958 RepID=UPI00041DAE99|nr:replication initiator [Amycolatopsis orientalis]